MGHLIGYIKGKETKGIFIRKPKVIKAIILCYSNYTTDKKTKKSVRGIVAIIRGTLLTCSSKTQITVTLIITEAECVALPACAQEVNVVNMLLE